MGVPEGACTKLGSISTSHQQEWPSCYGYSRARLWAKASPGQSPRTPPPPTSTHSGARRIPGAWWCEGSPREQRRCPQRCVYPQRPEWGLHGMGSAQVAQSRRRAGQGGWPGRGTQVLPGQRHPYLPSSVEGSRGAEAVSPMAAETWPETAASGSSHPSRRRVPSRPLGI